MRACVVVNPRSGNGRTARDWKTIERKLTEVYPDRTVYFSKGPNDIKALVRIGLMEGHDEIVAVGGDGTINEAVNGFFDANGMYRPEAVFAFVTSGTGGDFRKSFGIAPGADAAIARLKTAVVRAVDVGRVSCLTAKGERTQRYFINIA
jgi:diacylglycerol kinase (ATP)